MSRKRKTFSKTFKAKVALEAAKGFKTISELSKEYLVHPNAISNWKKQLLENAGELFDTKRGRKAEEEKATTDQLYQQIGKLQVELEWLKKNMNLTVEQLRAIVEPCNEEISIVRQSSLINLPRSSFYYQPREILLREIEIMNKIDRIYTECPFYGSPRITAELIRRGEMVNHKRVERLMRVMGIAAIMLKRNLSKRDKDHLIYPYLLRCLEITRNDHVWSSDITYIPIHTSFVYLVAIIDWFSRFVLSWEISNTLDYYFCIEALDKALRDGRPEIFNTDQGSQFTSKKYTKKLLDKEIKISMDSRGRALDNIFIERFWRSLKYEDIYLKDYQSVRELLLGIEKYFYFYNYKRSHQSLDYKTPAEVYFNACLP